MEEDKQERKKERKKERKQKMRKRSDEKWIDIKSHVQAIIFLPF